MIQIGSDVAQAVVNLRTNPDFQKVVSWLAHTAEHHNHALIHCKPEDLERFQGMTRATTDIIEAISAAPQIIREMKDT